MKQVWSRFLHWSGWRTCGKFFASGWKCIASWSGWRAIGSFFARCWRKTVGWKGWKKLLFIHPALLLLLVLLCAAGLTAVFRNGWDMTVFAFVLYGISAYTLTAACIRLPGAFRGLRSWIRRHPGLNSTLENKEAMLRFRLILGQLINFGYGLFKTIGGFLYGSVWLVADGIYNLMQGVIQLFHVLRRRKSSTMLEQWKSYRVSGVLILLLHLTMSGLIFLMVNRGMGGEYPGIMIFATAAFTFYKTISAMIRVAKDRRHANPADSAVRMLKLSQAFFSMFSLQVGMLHVFGDGSAWERWINAASGCAVCLLVVSMGIYMIRRANRDMKPFQEVSNG